MYIIDTTKKEFEDIPKTLNGDILLDITKDSNNKVSGYISIKPEYLKYYAENMTKEQLEGVGLGKHKVKLDWIKNKSDIDAVAPEVA